MSISRLRDSLAVTIVLALAGCGSAAAPPAAPTPTPVVTADGVQRVELTYAGGTLPGGPARYAVPVGSTVELVVASDVADEVHLHGYDRRAFVTAGATATLRFVADVPGVYEVELEQAGAQLAQVQVS